ncbi:MAG: PEP-CTERM sorting domain-containing protein [Phycisphaerales bacterium]|nr:PEP-CTERM sorting domain-containing protein [Phycisphaerales bacterium]
MKIIALIAICGFAGAAQASPLIQTQSFTGIPDYDQTFTFNQFDSALGTLTGINVTLQLDISGGFLGVDNDGIDPAVVNVEFGASGILTSLPGLFLSLTTSNSATFNLAADDLDGPGVQTTGPDYDELSGVATSSSTSSAILAAFFSNYIGLGTFDILADINQVIDFGGVSGVAGQFDPQVADIIVTVGYKYDPIPAPGSMALLGLGGLIATRRRR